MYFQFYFSKFQQTLAVKLIKAFSVIYFATRVKSNPIRGIQFLDESNTFKDLKDIFYFLFFRWIFNEIIVSFSHSPGGKIFEKLEKLLFSSFKTSWSLKNHAHCKISNLNQPCTLVLINIMYFVFSKKKQKKTNLLRFATSPWTNCCLNSTVNTVKALLLPLVAAIFLLPWIDWKPKKKKERNETCGHFQTFSSFVVKHVSFDQFVWSISCSILNSLFTAFSHFSVFMPSTL